MCGVAGFAGWDIDPAGAGVLLRGMCDAIRHRGPDDEGFLVGDGIALGMRRLSIIDVGGGHQPISNEDGTVSVVFNGEIYNHHELRSRLERRGHRFATRSDTEVIVHLYEDTGPGLVKDLRGMFGIALWDAKLRRLLLARDRLGIKPLHYWQTSDGLAFASELRSFVALDRFPRLLSSQAVARFLSFGYVPDPLCIFREVRKIPPGHLLTWDVKHGPVIERYWTPAVAESSGLDEVTAVEELRRLLVDAVRSHLESEVPLGAFLSGGIDSSSVVACMAAQAGRKVRTFSIGFEEERFNEAPDAAKVAEALGTEHTQLILRPDADRLIEDVIRAFDEPFADSSALPTMLVSQLARQHVTVALSGDGGDEMFGGYTRYFDILRRSELRPPALRSLFGTLGRALPHATIGRNRLLDLARTLRGRYTATVATPLRARDGGLAREDLAGEDDRFEQLLAPLFEEASQRDFATQMMLVDVMSYLPGDILTKVDRTTMATSLEARVPLLDHVFVEFALSVPSRLKVRDGKGKWILRRAIEGLVPPFVLQKPKKGFGVPLGSWFRRELRHRVDELLTPGAVIYEFADPRAVRRIALEHRFGRRDHSSSIWRLMTLELWLGFLDRGSLAKPTTDLGDLTTATS